MSDWPKWILALDVPRTEVDGVLSDLGSLVACCKVGLSTLASPHLMEVVEKVKRHGSSLFIDGKLHDIPNTVANAAKSLVELGARYFTVHASGGRDMMKAAKEAAEERAAALGVAPAPLPIAVTVLTSMDESTWHGLFQASVTLESQVLRFVERALYAGLNAVVASPMEVEAIRARFGKDLAIVTPGVRPSWAAKGDQKRIAEPAQTLARGATSLVIGRPVLFPPAEVGGRRKAAERILEEIGGA
jgi:orotidine-5'-phosphate decarboxylase